MSSINPQYSSSQELSEQYRAQTRQKEELQAQHEAEIENLKKSYSAEKADLEDRYESSNQSERLAHYDHLRNLKSQINREERGLEMQGREEIRNKERALLQENVRTDQEGRSKLDDTRKKFAVLEEYERQKQRAVTDEVHGEHLKNTEIIVKNSEKSIEDLRNQKEQFLEDQKGTHNASLDQMQNHYQSIRDQKHQQYLKELNAVEDRSMKDLNQRKLASAEKMNQFESKSQDPFYQIKKFDSDLLDVGDAFVLRVKVPEYERKNMKVQVSGQDLQLIGVRTSDEKAVDDAGRTISTRSHQTVSEKFSLDAPVDPKSVSVSEDGEWMQYTIPKFGPHHKVNERYSVSPLAEREQSHMAKELGFAESLPRPSLLNQESGKGTLS